MVSPPDRSDAEDGDLCAVNACEDIVVFLNNIHVVVAVLVCALRNDDLIGRVTRHLHERFAVVDITSDTLVDDIIIKISVGDADICFGRTQRPVALSN